MLSQSVLTASMQLFATPASADTTWIQLTTNANNALCSAVSHVLRLTIVPNATLDFINQRRVGWLLVSAVLKERAWKVALSAIPHQYASPATMITIWILVEPINACYAAIFPTVSSVIMTLCVHSVSLDGTKMVILAQPVMQTVWLVKPLQQIAHSVPKGGT